jgi:hypothetical protein
MADVRFDKDRIIKAAQRAFAQTATDLDAQFKAEISAPKWSWPGPTKRRNGQAVSSPRDIVDEGDLLASQRYQVAVFAADWEWAVQYSAIVHQGNGSNVPARPWTETALQAKDWAKHFEQKWGENL